MSLAAKKRPSQKSGPHLVESTACDQGSERAVAQDACQERVLGTARCVGVDKQGAPCKKVAGWFLEEGIRLRGGTWRLPRARQLSRQRYNIIPPGLKPICFGADLRPYPARKRRDEDRGRGLPQTSVLRGEPRLLAERLRVRRLSPWWAHSSRAIRRQCRTGAR